MRSYRTVSPLPRHESASRFARSAVYFLWHYPGPCERWVLPTTVSCEARTFLDEITRGNSAAAARPAPIHDCTMSGGQGEASPLAFRDRVSRRTAAETAELRDSAKRFG